MPPPELKAQRIAFGPSGKGFRKPFLRARERASVGVGVRGVAGERAVDSRLGSPASAPAAIGQGWKQPVSQKQAKNKPSVSPPPAPPRRSSLLFSPSLFLNAKCH